MFNAQKWKFRFSFVEISIFRLYFRVDLKLKKDFKVNLSRQRCNTFFIQ